MLCGLKKTEPAGPAAGICCDLQGKPQIRTAKAVATRGPGQNAMLFLLLPRVISRHTSFVESRHSSAQGLDAFEAVGGILAFNARNGVTGGANE